jgi:predicted RNA-binding protein
MWIEERIRTLEKEIEALRETLLIIDGFLLQKGFKPAAEIQPEVVEKIKEVSKTEVIAEEVVSLKVRDGRVVATAYLTPKTITVILASTIKLKTSTPPFTSYLIGKKLPQMVQADKDQAKNGATFEEDVLSFSVEEEGGFIRKITLKNYRTKIRLKEILNLMTWTFEKMIEKS